ncbi:MAG: hypothetical protein E6G65_01570 [Actinobacteria bacterium]|nr:MAG: hypothetical protein E6G65_01570 [Actinomycetota bacterium]
MRVLVASQEGLHPFDDRGAARPRQLAGRAVNALAPRGPELWAAVDGSELWHASGDEWDHVADLPGLRITSIATTDADVFVGSSEARLFRVVGDRLEPVAAFDRADGRSSWYTPWGGPPETRSLSEWDDDLYVNVDSCSPRARAGSPSARIAGERGSSGPTVWRLHTPGRSPSVATSFWCPRRGDLAAAGAPSIGERL